MRAVTVWSLLGAYDWDSLLTQRAGHYEPGVFAITNDRPQPTPLAGFVRHLARSGEARHPALSTPGWWRRPERLLHPYGPEGAEPVNESRTRELCSV
jgi:dTDP-4-dehydrorhamnose reductase